MTELSIVIPAWNEQANLALLLPELKVTLAALGVDAEILVLDAGSRDGTDAVCRDTGARLLDLGRRGYGRALCAGLEAACGVSVLTLGTPDYGRRRWRFIERIYSRLVPGGYAAEHVTHYTREGLILELGVAGFDVDDERYIGGGELIMLSTKRVRGPDRLLEHQSEAIQQDQGTRRHV